MGSEACIYPSCDCKGYQDPGHPKGSLLLLMRLGCKKCGHHGSEHRSLTMVDRMVREEVERVTNVRCSCIIPHNEISRSPIFKPYDPIPVPYDDEDESGGVQCTCPGFQITSLVKLWQSFRSYSSSAVVSLLPSIICSSCSHTLQDHQPRPGGACNTSLSHNHKASEGERGAISEIASPHLTLKASTRLSLAPFEGCVQLLPPNELVKKEREEENEKEKNELTLVSLHCPSEGNLHIIVNSIDLSSKETQSSDAEDREEITTGSNRGANTSTHITGKECNETAEEREDVEVATHGIVCGVSKDRRRGRKRRRSVVLLPAKKRARLQKQTKKRKIEEEAEKEKAAKAKKQREREAEKMRAKQLEICGRIVDFTSSLEDRSSFTHYPLPKEIIQGGVEKMTVARSKGVGDGLILSLGTASGLVYIVLVRSGDDKLTWLALNNETSSSDENIVKCMSWLEKGSNQFHLSVGYDRGSVIVWKLKQIESQLEQLMVSKLQDTDDDITMICWDFDTMMLVVGTQAAEILFYNSVPVEKSEEKEEYQLNQKLSCGASAITCSRWMNSGCVLAVGGTDDSIHILQRKQSTSKPANSKSSLLSYFKPVDADKFVYTHWLRGHSSFVSSLLFVGSTSLLSLGWDNHLLFWRGIEPLIRITDGEVLPIEDDLPQAGFRLGPSAAIDYIPLSVCGVGGFGIIVLFINKTRRVDFVYYTLQPISL